MSSQTNIEGVLSDEWQAFEFDLAVFEHPDPNSLDLVLSLLSIQPRKAVALGIRAAKLAERH